MLARRGAAITFRVARALHPLLGALTQTQLVDGDGPETDELAFHSPLMALPWLIDPSGATIPEPLRMTIPATSHAAMQRAIAPHGSKWRIGIAWSGSSRNDERARHAVTLDQFLPLAMLPGAQVFSLQKGAALAELRRPAASRSIVDLGSACADFGDTAAALERMDLVVATDGVIAHLAGCMGKPVLNLLHTRPCWIYGLHGDSTPHYPSMRLLRQSRPGEWDGVFAEVCRLVGAWAAIHRSSARCLSQDD